MDAEELARIAKGLSDASKAVAGAWFGLMRPGKSEVTFQLREARPSDEAQAGLNDLVEHGIISVEPFNRYGGLVYRPLVDCHCFFVWLGKNRANPAAKIRMTVPLASEKEARAHQKAALTVRNHILSETDHG
jgi:hypothetical protein